MVIAVGVMVLGMIVIGAGCQKAAPGSTVDQSVNRAVNVPTEIPATNATLPVDRNVANRQPVSVPVSITASGFVPSSVTVNVGDTVVWTNHDSAPHQPAVDPHPTHTNLPGFDAVGGLQPGESFQFTFLKIGSWAYHDHLNPESVGIVIVN